MKSQKISVIVPIYNLQDYIGKTVESIRNQTYRNLEIILVDDGSKDNTWSILQRLAEEDDRIKIIHKENGGVTSARILGMKAATGSWIGFVDGDDYVEPKMYEVLMENAIKYQADISHCGYQMVFPSHVDYYYNTEKILEQDNQAGMTDLLSGEFIEPGLWVKLFRKRVIDAFLESVEMDFSIKINEDLLMNYYFFRNATKSVYMDKCLYHYVLRKGSASTSHINVNKVSDPLKVLKILEFETRGNAELLSIVQGRIVAQLVNIASMSLKGNEDLIHLYQISAIKELRGRLPRILSGKISFKRKIIALWVAICPWSYRIMHAWYANLTGVDKKYVVE